MLNRLLLITIIFISFGSGFSYAESNPRSITDIEKLLNQSKSNTEQINNDLKILSETAPTAATKLDLYNFYFNQALAADRLGKVNVRISASEKALENATNVEQETKALQDISNAYYFAGNPNKAITLLLGIYPKESSMSMGARLGVSSALSRFYAAAGDFQNSEKYLKITESQFSESKRLSGFSSFGFIWTRNYYQTIAELAFQQGKFEAAEIAYRKAIESMELGIDEYEKSYNRNKSLNTSTDPNLFRFVIEYLYLKESSALLELRKLNESEYYAREALKKSLGRTGKLSFSTAAALKQLGVVMMARGRYKDAINLFNHALASLKEVGVTEDSALLLATKKSLASALIADHKYGEALKIYAELDKTILTYPEAGRFVDSNSPERILALIQTGSYVEAEKYATRLLNAAQARTGSKSKETLDAKLMLATTLAEQKKDAEAKTLFAQGMSELIDQEREIATDSEGASAKEKAYQLAYIESYLGVLSRSQTQSPNSTLIAQSFELGDIARSSGVQRALNASTARAHITDPRLAELARKEQDLNQQITFLSRFVKELSMAPPTQQLPQVQANIKKDIENLRGEAKRTFKEIEKNFPEYADLISPKPVSLASLQKTLRPNEALVTWFIGKKSSYVWAVSRDAPAQFKSIPLTQDQLKKTVTQIRKSLDPNVSSVEEIPVFNFALAAQLYDSLFKPVQTALEGKNTLVVVPQDEVANLPLGVLLTTPFTLAAKEDERFSSYRSAPWLIKKFAIVSIPSATSLSSLRNLPKPKEGRFDFIGFGDPIFSTEQAKELDKRSSQLTSRGIPLQLRNVPNTSQVSSAEVSILPRLPDTKEEILEVAKVFTVNPNRDIFLEKRATLDEVMKTDLSNRKVVMFSTHGLVPGELNGLNQPALALTNPAVLNEKGDGLLKVDQILNLKLNADWVVLSACNTAAGEGDGAEALSGLGRAFFYAGARSLLVSSWPVDSQASRKLMVDLFQRQNKDQAISKPQALQQASLSMIEKGRPDEKDGKYSYAHPLFWAPFVVVGD